MRNFTAAASFIVLTLACHSTASAQSRIDRNVVYGMYSGLALLMDVYRPDNSNGTAIVAVQGSGWYAPMRYDAPQLKDTAEVGRQARLFSAAGYTVFVVNHRQTPRFRYPDPIEDVQRAVRFVRFHSKDYGITSDRIGAWGSSSGGHMVSLLGTLDGKGEPSDSDPVNRLDAKVQAVVAFFAPSELSSLFATMDRPGVLTSLMGFAYQDPASAAPSVRADDFENRQYREASPLTHVSRDDAPMLMLHGDADTIVPIGQSEMMEKALQSAGVAVKFIRVPGGLHGANFRLPSGDPRVPDYVGEALKWFDSHLRPAPAAKP